MICPVCGGEVHLAHHIRTEETCREVFNDGLSRRFRESYEPSSGADPDMEVTKR